MKAIPDRRLIETAIAARLPEILRSAYNADTDAEEWEAA